MTARADDRSEAEVAPPPVAIDLRHLRYFVAVSEELHFGHAAERLHIAQPPLSQAIRKLEDELGVMLLHRTSRVVELTEAGRAFAEEAKKVLAAFTFAVAEARRAGEPTSALRIGCVPNLPIERLLRFLAGIQALVRDSPPQVVHLTAVEQVRRLHNGELDLGILHSADEYEGIDSAPLFEGEPLAAFLRPAHPLAASPALQPRDVGDETLVILPRDANPPLHDALLARIERAGYRFRTIKDAGAMDVRDLLLAAASGVGIAFAPFSVKEVSEAGGLVVRRELDPPVSMPETVLAWRSDGPRKLEELLPALQSVAAALRDTDDQPTIRL
jgi:DNA-binding transcriptional LysR family regulator